MALQPAFCGPAAPPLAAPQVAASAERPAPRRSEGRGKTGASLGLLAGAAALSSRRTATARRGRERRAENAPGQFFVDESCIDCDTCRWMAPETFARAAGKSAVVRQPEAAGESRAALRAMSACPTGSIRTERPEKKMTELLEETDFLLEQIDEALPGVYHTGFHSKRSFGATPYLLVLPSGEGVLVDTPRFNSKLLQAVQAVCEPKYLFLSHIDDVADHQKWRDALPGLRRVMHTKDIYGSGNWLGDKDLEGCEVQLEGEGPWDLEGKSLEAGSQKELWVHWLPGHSEGSIALCWRPKGTFEGSAVFTGDSLASNHEGKGTGMPRYNSAGRKLQADNILGLKEECGAFEWILPGHFRRLHSSTPADFERALQEASAGLLAW